MADEVRVAILFDPAVGYSRGMIGGLRRFQQEHAEWRVRTFFPSDDPQELLGLVREWQAAGVIGHLAKNRLVRAIQSLHVPVVNVSNRLANLALPRAGLDDVAIGRLGAEHLLNLGLRHFGYVGYQRNAYAVDRQAGYEERLAAAGCSCSVFPPSGEPALAVDSWALWNRQFEDWLAKLPKPAGVFACNDERAYYVAEACHLHGHRIPDELALLGVDNDEVWCQLAFPPLSSIRLPSEQIGYEAAGLLSRLLAGEVPPAKPLLLPPAGVAVRASTGNAETTALEATDLPRWSGADG